jgi:hypothetical protein
VQLRPLSSQEDLALSSDLSPESGEFPGKSRQPSTHDCALFIKQHIVLFFDLAPPHVDFFNTELPLIDRQADTPTKRKHATMPIATFPTLPTAKRPSALGPKTITMTPQASN